MSPKLIILVLILFQVSITKADNTSESEKINQEAVLQRACNRNSTSLHCFCNSKTGIISPPPKLDKNLCNAIYWSELFSTLSPQNRKWSWELYSIIITTQKHTKEFTVEGCNLTTLENNVFPNSTILIILNLARNNIEKIQNSSLPKTLQHLNFSHNLFTELPNDENIDSSNLQTLDFSYNRIGHIDSSISLFQKAVKLKLLRLEGNQINTISDNAFRYMVLLENLNLSFNKILFNFPSCKANVTRTWFNDISERDCIVDLSNNLISGIPIRNSNEERLRPIRKLSLKKLKLNENPLRCNCESFDLIDYFYRFNTDTTLSSSSVIGNLSCMLEDGNKTRSANISELNPKYVYCDLANCIHCPQNCTCRRYLATDDLIINCSNSGLLSVPQNLPSIMTNELNVHLDLSYNLITNFSFNNDFLRCRIKSLYLSGNKIDKLPSDLASFKFLQMLKLDNNSLNVLDHDTVVILKNLNNANLYLGNNPFDCDNCKNSRFSSYIKENELRVKDRSLVQCMKPKKKLLMDTNIIGCTRSHAFFVITAILSCVVLLLLIISKCVWDKWKMNNLMRHPRFETIKLLDKTYDAFISFSHEDETLVHDLVDKLENRKDDPFTLCLHTRHWIPGEFIVKQMVESINQSRCSIIILSPAYVSSDWCYSEFQLAMTEMVVKKRHRVIVVLLCDDKFLDKQSKLRSDFQFYFRQCTYLKYDDEKFMDKLIAAIRLE